MPTQCCVPQCSEVGGHVFPKYGDRRRNIWIKVVRCGEKDWRPSKHSVVCQNHFDKFDYIEVALYGTAPLQHKLKPTAIPHIFQWDTNSTEGVNERSERAKNRLQMMETQQELDDKQRNAALLDVGAQEVVVTETKELDDIGMATTLDCVDVKPTSSSRSVQTLGLCNWFCIEMFADDTEAEGLHYYTGLETYDKFLFLLEALGPAANDLLYYHGTTPSISIPNQLFLTLIKLRQQHESDFELKTKFRMSKKSVANVYITWINFMANEFEEINWWPSREFVDYYMPTDFKAKFPATRVILDGAEFPIMKSQQLVAQQATFSSYKNRNTVKVVVGSSPGGLVSYMSPAYGGSASDPQIIERNDLVDNCDPGDSLMVDKGFNIEDLLIPKQVKVNIPSFFRKKNRMSGSAVISDRKIANKRVHIERIIGLAKTYRILREPMKFFESSLATKIIGVCFALCNFRSCIVSKNA